jgi:tetratricopeptide (TPR) repeat protein
VIFWTFPTPEETFYGGKGYCYMQLGWYERAIRCFERALKDSGEPRVQSFLHSAIGYCHSQLGRDEQPKDRYEKAKSRIRTASSPFNPYQTEPTRMTEGQREKLIEEIMSEAEKGHGKKWRR